MRWKVAISSPSFYLVLTPSMKELLGVSNQGTIVYKRVLLRGLFDPTFESEIFCHPKNIFETFF